MVREMGDTHLCEATTGAAISESAIEVSGRGRGGGGGIATAGTSRNDMVCVWIIIVGVVILISGRSAARAWNRAHGETRAGATMVGKEGIIYGRAVARTISTSCGIVIVIEWSTMETGGGESCRDGGVVLEASGSTAATDGKEDPENDGGGGKADQDKDASNGTGIAKKSVSF